MQPYIMMILCIAAAFALGWEMKRLIDEMWKEGEGMLKQGECVYFVFQNGKSVLDSQNRPRMYKTEQQFKKKFPGHNHTEVVELVKYAPVRYGNWIPHDDELDGLTNECSVCHCEGMIHGNYCPYCGAKMDLDDSEDWEG